MTTTDVLGITLIEQNQSLKEVTANEALNAFADSIAETLALDLGALSSPYTLASPDPALRFMMLSLGGSPAGAFTVNHPAAKHLFLATNGTAQTVTVKVSGQTGVALAAGAAKFLYCDGTDVGEVGLAAGTVTLAGDVTGASGATVAAALQGIAVSTTDPTTGQALVYNGTAWAPASQAHDLAAYYPGAPAASATLLRHVAVRAWSLPTNAAGSALSAGTAATASTVLTLRKNGASVGTATVAIAGTTATFSVTATSFAVNDLFTVTAPASADATLADVALSILGTR